MGFDRSKTSRWPANIHLCLQFQGSQYTKTASHVLFFSSFEPSPFILYSSCNMGDESGGREFLCASEDFKPALLFIFILFCHISVVSRLQALLPTKVTRESR